MNDLPVAPRVPRPTASRYSVYARRGKRIMDISIATLLLVATTPLQLSIVVSVRLRLGSPVLFRQMRPGLHGQTFEMLKFRTMTNERDAIGELLPDAERLPPFGQFLRSTSLDELPGLINVVRGDLSLVGPRPLLVHYLELYTPRQAQRHKVRPGITGLAQVSGRNALSWEEKFELDLHYVENVSFGLDMRILWRTLWNVLARKDISSGSHATMPEFGVSEAA